MCVHIFVCVPNACSKVRQIGNVPRKLPVQYRLKFLPGLQIAPRSSIHRHRQRRLKMPRRRRSLSHIRSNLRRIPPRKRDAAQAGSAPDLGDVTGHDDDDNPPADTDRAALILRTLLLSKFALGLMSAKDVAELSYWIHQCGVVGFQDLGKRDPALASFSSNAAKSVSTVMKLPEIDASFYYFTAPVNDNGARVHKLLPMHPLHELMAFEFCNFPDECIEAQGLDTENWRANALRTEAAGLGQVAVPVGHFIDAAAWKGKGAGTADSILCFYFNVLGRDRRLCFLIRKDDLCGEGCGCPCRGRCTLEAVEQVLEWSAICAATGLHPSVDHRGLQLDPARAALAGQPLATTSDGRGVRFALAEIRADGAQYADMGLHRANQEGFCLKCRCNRKQMYNFEDAHAIERWTHESYIAGVTAAQVCVRISEEDAQEVFQHLAFDMRKDKGKHGRVLKKNLVLVDSVSGQFVSLCKWDRLERWGSCIDTHCEFEGLLGKAPFELRFWRDHENFPYRHAMYMLHWPAVRYEYLTLDDLHNLDLGVTSRLAGTVMVQCLKEGKRYGNSSTETGLKKGITYLSVELRQFYSASRKKARRKAKRTVRKARGISCIGKITLSMLSWKNQSSTGHLKCKGGEARDVLPFVVKLAAGLSDKNLVVACQKLRAAYA